MRTLVITLFFTILIGIKCLAQNSEINIVYQLFKNGDIIHFDVKILDDFSTYKVQETKENTPNDFVMKVTTPGSYIFEKIKKENKLYYSEPIMTKRFYVVDSLHPMKWKINKEIKSILGYPCQKAQTHFRGRDYIAYFTKKIPVNNGPYKFGGLPGLILEVYSTDGEIKFLTKSINFSKNTITHVPSYTKYYGKYISHQDFVSTYITTWKNIIAKLKSRAEEHVPGDEDYIKSHEIEIKYPALQLGRGMNLNE